MGNLGAKNLRREDAIKAQWETFGSKGSAGRNLLEGEGSVGDDGAVAWARSPPDHRPEPASWQPPVFWCLVLEGELRQRPLRSEKRPSHEKQTQMQVPGGKWMQGAGRQWPRTLSESQEKTWNPSSRKGCHRKQIREEG